MITFFDRIQQACLQEQGMMVEASADTNKRSIKDTR
jgi:hypothetical protein